MLKFCSVSDVSCGVLSLLFFASGTVIGGIGGVSLLFGAGGGVACGSFSDGAGAGFGVGGLSILLVLGVGVC